MRFLAELGIGLSVVFGIFFVALLAELCYIFFWKEKGSPTAAFSAAADCIKACRTRTDTILRTQKEKKKQRITHRSSAAGEFVREASMVGSFGGLYVPAASDLQSGQIGHGNMQIEAAKEADGSSHDSLQNLARQLPRLLFPITEESKEDLERQASSSISSVTVASITSNLNLVPRAALPSIPNNIGDMISLYFAPSSASTSPAVSADTPTFTTPPISSPPLAAAKLSPYAARAVSQTITSSSHNNSRTSPFTAVKADTHAFTSLDQVAIIGSDARGLPPLRDDHQVHGRGTESGRTPLQLLFEQSPLLKRSTTLCKESQPAASPPQLHAPTFPETSHRRSLAALFEELSTTASRITITNVISEDAGAC